MRAAPLRKLPVSALVVTLFATAPMISLARHEQAVTVQASGRVTVVGKEFQFIPNVIRIERGQAVTIVFKDEGALSHNLTIPGLHVRTPTIQSGAQATLHFIAKEAGTFPFWCTVPGHKEAGMRGTVVIR